MMFKTKYTQETYLEEIRFNLDNILRRLALLIQRHYYIYISGNTNKINRNRYIKINKPKSLKNY